MDSEEKSPAEKETSTLAVSRGESKAASLRERAGNLLGRLSRRKVTLPEAYLNELEGRLKASFKLGPGKFTKTVLEEFNGSNLSSFMEVDPWGKIVPKQKYNGRVARTITTDSKTNENIIVFEVRGFHPKT